MHKRWLRGGAIMDFPNNLLSSVLTKVDRLLDEHVNHRPMDVDIERFLAFTWNGKRKTLSPVQRPAQITPAELLGIDDHKKRVLENTRNFINGRRANNVLLWGERGTGKSSLVKSLLSEFANTDLRIIQVFKHDILTVQELYDFISRNKRYRFILFIDDLSFEESQTDYKEMKTMMDGGLEQIPENLVFYATSNRKHLIPTKFSDNDIDEIRPADTIEEKVSLADRFGIRLGFYHFSQETYLDIVSLYSKKYGISLDEQELHELSLQWSLLAGGRNGRIAEQFVRSLTS